MIVKAWLLITLLGISLCILDGFSSFSSYYRPGRRFEKGPDIQAWRDLSYMSRVWYKQNGGNPEFYPGEERP